jgi:hypothetical protein
MIKNLLPTVWRRSESPMRRVEEHPFFALHREMNQMFDEFFHSFDLAPFGGEKSFGSGPFLPLLMSVRMKMRSLSRPNFLVWTRRMSR